MKNGKEEQQIGKEQQQQPQQKQPPEAIKLQEIRQILYHLELMEKQMRSSKTHGIKEWIALAEMLWTIYDGISECLDTGKYAIGIDFAVFLDNKLKQALVKLTRRILHDITYDNSTRGLTDIREMRISEQTVFASIELQDTIYEIKKLYTERIFHSK
jgi:hypothetical protein